MSEPSCQVRVRVTPRSSQNRLEVASDDVLKARLQAPPVDGAANSALVELLAKSLRCPKSTISIVSGHSSRDKIVRISGMDSRELWSRLGRPKLMED